MFIGHYAVAFAAKRAAPRASLGLLVAAAQLADLLWPIFLLLGWETVRIAPGDTAFSPLAFTHYPISHSLLAMLGWGVLFALLYGARTRDRTGALVLGALVVSHWVLDAVVHRPDLPLVPGGTTLIGLGLWNSVAGTLLVEGVMWVAGIWAYASFTRPRDRIGRYALWALVVLLTAIYATNLFGAPPPNARALAWFALAGWLIPLLAWWVDRHRAPASRIGAADAPGTR